MHAKSFRRTTIGCFVGIFTQAVITNLTAILFVPMMKLYSFDYRHLGILVAVNFVTQVAADISFCRAIDRIGYRRIVLPACVAAAVGLLVFACTPWLFHGAAIFPALIASTVIFAFSSGLMEILLSPIVAAIPGNDKGPAMSLMHSFYAWGQAATIIVTTLALSLIGSARWQFIAIGWMVVPAVAFVIFIGAPFPETVPETHRQGMRKLLFRPFYILCLLAIFLGAGAEVVMNQWASTFMEKGLNLPKVVGDLLGMCGFAVMLGLGRTLYGIFGSKLNMSKTVIAGSAVAVVCYLGMAFTSNAVVNIACCAVCGIAVSLLWPGTIVLASDRYPLAGAWLFAILAAAGDIGASVGPYLTGEAVDRLMGTDLAANLAVWLGVTGEQAALRLGLMIAAVFPILAVAVHMAIKRMNKVKSEG